MSGFVCIFFPLPQRKVFGLPKERAVQAVQCPGGQEAEPCAWGCCSKVSCCPGLPKHSLSCCSRATEILQGLFYLPGTWLLGQVLSVGVSRGWSIPGGTRGENSPLQSQGLQGGKQLSFSTIPFIIISVLVRSTPGHSWDNLDLGTNMFFCVRNSSHP